MWHPTKDSFFHIKSFVDQFYRSWSIYLKRSHLRKINFSENFMPNIISKVIKYLAIIVILFNKSVQENKSPIASNKTKKIDTRLFTNNPIDWNGRISLKIDELFVKA